MKLRALHLVNVRKFTGQQASIVGIGDGITVVSEANEFGKSTFFDALHALFFEKYSSVAKPIKSLQPRAGGGVEIAAEIETNEGAFRVEKRFLYRKSARIVRASDGTTIAQDDEAERWIATLTGAAGDGPAGLLWVRQGLVGLEPEATKVKTQQMETRRDLLSSVAGEIDAMTGGRRMDRVMRRVAEDLAAITTKTGRKSGPWKEAADLVATLETQLKELDTKRRALDAALQERRQCEAEMKRLDDPEAKSRREAACAAARTAMQAAEAHAAQLRHAVQARDLAQLQEINARGALDAFLAAQEACRSATTARDLAETGADEVRAQVEAARSGASEAGASHRAAKARLEQAQARLTQALRQDAARRAGQDAARLAAEIARAEAEAERRDAARAQLATSKADAAWLRRAEAAEAEVLRLERAVAARASKARVEYSGAARVLCDGRVLEEGETLSLGAQAVFELPEIGRLILSSGQEQSAREISTALDAARQARAALFDEADVSTIAQAQAAAERFEAASRAADLADQLLASLAPRGIEALKAERAQADLLAGQASEEPLLPRDRLEADLDLAQEEERQCRETAESAEREHARAREAAIAAQGAADAARRDLERATAAAGPQEERETRRNDLLRAHATAERDSLAAAATVEDLQARAPDLETLAADLERAHQAMTTMATRRSQTSERLASLSAEIRASAGSGVEEQHAECADRLEQARNAEARYARQAACLNRLQDALDAERSAARDTYFGPVRDELRPLLSILHDDAELSFDSDTLLPSELSRGSAKEKMDTLSGGTQEQIAILTRLAFARLLARQGRRLPIVLDDALVYSDDDRIIKMFTALTRVAAGQQIIVFSCRQLAFQDLGGARPRVELQPV